MQGTVDKLGQKFRAPLIIGYFISQLGHFIRRVAFSNTISEISPKLVRSWCGLNWPFTADFTSIYINKFELVLVQHWCYLDLQRVYSICNCVLIGCYNIDPWYVVSLCHRYFLGAQQSPSFRNSRRGKFFRAEISSDMFRRYYRLCSVIRTGHNFTPAPLPRKPHERIFTVTTPFTSKRKWMLCLRN